MDNNRTYTTTVRLNAQEAQDELKKLEARVEEFKRKKEKAFSEGNIVDGEKFSRQMKQAERDLRTFKLQTMDVQAVLNDLGSATTSQINKAMRSLRSQMSQLPTDSEEFRELNDRLQQCKNRLAEIGQEAKQSRQETESLRDNLANLSTVMGNLQGASLNQLRQAEHYLQGQVGSLSPNSTSYDVALSQLKEVRLRIGEMNEAQKETVTIIDQYNKELEAAGLGMRKVSDGAELVGRTMGNIDAASMRDIEYTMRLINEQMKDVETGSEEFHRLNGQLGQCKQRMADIAQEQKKLKTLIDQYDEEIKNINRDVTITQREQELVNKTLAKMSTANIRDLEYSLKIINQQLRDTERGGEPFDKLTEKARQLNEELEKAKSESNASQSLFSRFITSLNKNWGAITQIIGAITGLTLTVRRCVEAFAEMDQEMNNVRKYTGQTIEEVKAMNEEFKRMDTRTPREQLNQLAGSAGRLGIQGTEAIRDFVYAADQINLALGDDLGKGAVDQIGKLAMAFGEDDRMGLRKAMLSTGSAVNELAQHSAANAGYLVDFAARLSGVGVQAGLTQAQILGLGAAMDENMQRDEMAATALSQIITKMTTDSETFARIAGKSVSEFASLVRTDMNAALLQFFEAMNRKGGFAELAPLFEQMGLDGTRAIGVLTTLSSKIADVERHQRLATRAYREHTSVEEEAAIQNNTYQAQLEKVRKSFNDLKVDLGEKLLPVVTMTITSGGLMVKALAALTEFVLKYKGVIITLTAAIAAYVVAVKAQWLWSQRYVAVQKLKALWMAVEDRWLMTSILKNRVLKGEITAAAAAQQFFNTVLKLNPYGLVLAGLTALIAMYVRYATSTNHAEEAQRRLKEVEEEANRNRPKEIDDMARLKKTIEDANVSIDNRREAIRELQKIVPEYHASLTNEGKLIGHNTELLNIYTQQLKNSAKIQVASQKLPEAEEKRDKWFNEAPANLQQAYFNERQGMDEESAAVAAGAVPRLYKAFKKHLNELDKAVGQYNGIIDRLTEENQKLADTLGGIDKTTSEGNTQEFDTLRFWEKEVELRKAKLDTLRQDANATRADVEKAKQAYDDATKAVEAFTGQKEHTRQERAEDKARRERERKANEAAKAETEQRLAELTHRYAMGQLLYCDYVDEQERIQLEGINRRMLIYRKESLEYQKLNRQREQLLLNGSEESQKLTEAQLKASFEERQAQIEEQAWRENQTEQWKNEQLFLAEREYLDSRRILYRQGTLERINLEREIAELEQQHKLQTEQYYQQQLQQTREQLLQMGNGRQKELALKGLKEMYDALIKAGIASEKEKQEAILAIEAQYANYQTQGDRDQRKAADMLAVASDAAKRQLDAATVSGGFPAGTPVLSTITLYQTTMEKLKQLYANDEKNHAAYLAAKQQATAQFCESLASQMQAAYNTVNQVVSAASSYFSAQQEYETAQVKAKYDRQIEAAGSNQRKVKKLQEQQQKEEAAIKTKYARRAAAIQMAQAVAQTAINAINAYGSAAAIPVTGYILAPIAAAMAIAAGMLQIATIKKQQQAQEAGYYEGGFTHGRRYRREAGVVHEGEFVANHQAVQNPAILPFLNFIDQAQRNNTVGSLTAQDVSRSFVGGGFPAPVLAPIVNVQTDNAELLQVVEAHREATETLIRKLDEGIEAYSVIDGPNGLYHNLKKYEQLISKK